MYTSVLFKEYYMVVKIFTFGLLNLRSPIPSFVTKIQERWNLVPPDKEVNTPDRRLPLHSRRVLGVVVSRSGDSSDIVLLHTSSFDSQS